MSRQTAEPWRSILRTAVSTLPCRHFGMRTSLLGIPVGMSKRGNGEGPSTSERTAAVDRLMPPFGPRRICGETVAFGALEVSIG